MLLIPLLGMKIFALVDAAYRKDAFFVAADKQNKAFWLIILAIFLVLQILIRSPLQMLNLVGTVAAVRLPRRRAADAARHAALLSQVPLIEGPDGPLEVLVTGSGEPVTVFAHGLAGSIDETQAVRLRGPRLAGVPALPRPRRVVRAGHDLDLRVGRRTT